MYERDPEPPTPERPQGPPRIYVASLADYNAGRLHGAWLDASQPVEELHAGIQSMLRRSREPLAEEFAIHDHDGFGPASLGEYESIDRVQRLASGIVEHGPAFAAWASHCDPAELDRFEEAYRGEWPSVTAYADELLTDLGATETLERVPDWLQPYMTLDIEGFARDLCLGGDVWTEPSSNGVYVFDGTI